jgi:5'-nucleotidase
MKRRTFINKAATSAAFVGLGGLSTNAFTAKRRKHLTVLHTNDVHSHIDAFPIDHQEYPEMGGLAKRASLVNSIRQENPNTLLFDAGDIFQGTPYFNFYGGELEFKLMSMLRYDAATIGNHDFDNGIEGLLAQMPYAKFELLSANYDFGNTLMDGYVKPYKIYWVDGLKIGVYGLGIALDGLVLPKLFKETKYLDPYEVATDCEYELKVRQACDLVICLSHMGYSYSDEQRPDDLGLAARTKNTQLIIGGHTHTFLEKPTIVANGNGDDVLVNQVGCYGIYLGRIDFYFEEGDGTATEGTRILIT